MTVTQALAARLLVTTRPGTRSRFRVTAAAVRPTVRAARALESRHFSEERRMTAGVIHRLLLRAGTRPGAAGAAEDGLSVSHWHCHWHTGRERAAWDHDALPGRKDSATDSES